MQIYNTYSRKYEPLNLGQKIGIYVCGITPYDTTHLGHAFTFLAYDVLIRYLRFAGAKVTYVQNVTDIDDPLFEKARQLNINWKKLGDKETNSHLANMDLLHALRPDHFVKVTDHIQEIIKVASALVEKDLAYVKKSAVYFEVKKYKKFGHLSKLKYIRMLKLANERGNFPNDPEKKDPLDFVLWQTSKPDEPKWDSPWGMGRPGWHIECCAMSLKYLGPTITIHGGGEDLIFPHHEAEMAIAQNYTGKKFVKTWMHTEAVYMHKEKMSKSLGNIVLIGDLLKKYSPEVIRFYLISNHYRKRLNYNENELIRAVETYKLLVQSSNKGKALNFQSTKKLIPTFFEKMENDLNIPKAIEEIIKIANSKNPHKASIVKTCLTILGL